MKRLSLAGRVALILLAAVLLVQAAVVATWFGKYRESSKDLFERANLRRIVMTTRLLDERTDKRERFALLAAINSPTLQVRLKQNPPDQDRGFGPPHVRRDISERLQRALPGHVVHVTFDWGRPQRFRPRTERHRWFEGERMKHHHPHDRPAAMKGRMKNRMMPGMPDCDPAIEGDCPDIDAGPDVLSGRMKALIAVSLSDGRWAAFTASLPDPEREWLMRLAGWNLLAALLAAVFAYFAARRLTRPVTRFAEGADRLGRDLDAPPLKESGAPEMRRATRAFNRMQQRLKRFVDDRTLMIAAISHDLRTVLTRLRLRAEYIADDEQRIKALRDLDDMAEMLTATLSFARDDAAEEPTDRVDLASLVRSLCDDLADAGQPVTFVGPDSAILTCRPVALRRAFGNILDNAIKYGERADVTLTTSDEEIRIAIADRGPGIPDDQKEEVFRPFYRMESSRNRETGGTGLGLAVVRNIVHRHGGEIELRDREGGGLEIVVGLPV
ncbi:ATP-binding protein [Magnetospira sp. QH-2]|uniref:ATP-binding protein n=1 Tax=Magnetospira sp. (strain QH-2) TaxID=1288970 RepID=UPI0003E80FA7|nr:ATP-binding protein [Magnetospira sp. QH-2]CCQ74786.1 putative histidine kinase [Magnetospira sp. QH-2]